jgi:release factor glutamine methyltransferase
MPEWTIRRILQWTWEHFRSKGIPTPRLDAELLLSHVLKKDRLYLYLNLDRPLTPPERSAYRTVVAQRVQRAPCSLIMGSKEFWSMDFEIRSGVLTPRPETETLVEVSLALLENARRPMALELGVGSAAVSASIASEVETVFIVGIDISPIAVLCARTNLETLGFSHRAKIARGDLFSPVKPGEAFDLIVSNPPYIPSSHIARLSPEVRDHEPIEALDGGADGLDVIRKICREAGDYMKPGGGLALEIGESQETPVLALLEETGDYTDIRSHKDLSYAPRVIAARKKHE